jgi:RNA polymerase sigma factor (sigma-70 family)
MPDGADPPVHEDDLVKRLERRDRSVLLDIDKKFSDRVRARLRKDRHLCLDSEAIEAIVDECLLAVWTRFKRANGDLGAFIFAVARNRLRDHIRRWKRHESGSLQRPLCLGQDGDILARPSSSPDQGLLEEELRRAIDEIVETQLTDRERTAFLRRFGTDRDDGWDKRLAAETGKTAKYWRKASDDAKNKVAAALQAKGLVPSGVGGRYEPTAKTSA